MINKNVLIILSLSLIGICSVQGATRKCVVCDSSSNTECATGITDIDSLSEECSTEDDDCIVFIDNENTVRGCAADFSDSCVDDNCSVCDTDNCNTEIFPSDRIRCHRCQGIECSTIVDDSNLQICQNYRESDTCYTVVENEESIYRGCFSDRSTIDEGKAKCLELEDNDWCLQCAESGCNNLPSISKTTLSCVKCSTDDKPECGYQMQMDDGELCNYDILLGRAEYCYRWVNGNFVQRGCLSETETPEEFLEECDDDRSEYCRRCKELNCNYVQGIHPGYCVRCNSINTPECANLDMTDIEEYVCPYNTIDKTGCYRSQIDNNVQRGCVSALSDGEYNLCMAGEDCKLCTGNMCNKKVDYQKCYECDSTTNKNCATLGSTLPEVVCKDYYDNCMTIVNTGNRATVRGCESVIRPDFCANANCSVCTNNYCNFDVFPPSRLYCNQCTEDDDNCNADLSSMANYRKPCPNYVIQETCFSVLSEDKEIIRGCGSDDDDGKRRCEDVGDKCFECTTNGCNNIPARKTPSLSCIKCETNSIPCQWGYDGEEAEQCTNYVYMGESESCYQVQHTDGTVERNCALDKPEVCPENSVECQFCTSTKCNVKSYKKQICISCRSDQEGQENCGEKAQGIAPTECTGEDQIYAKRGCYSMRIGGNVVIRGCAKDLNSDDDEKCRQDDFDSCIYCEANGCNTDDMSGASGLQINSSITLAIIFLITKFFY